VAALGLFALALAGCGQSSPAGPGEVPLLSGARVVQNVRRCDQGSHPFCSVDLVVVDQSYPSAAAFAKHERQYLHQHGWSIQEGEIAQEHSAVSPGNRWRVVYATAFGDLLAIDLGWIKRPPPIALALSRSLLHGEPAISLMLEAGPA
jgi:hypothetical protein